MRIKYNNYCTGCDLPGEYLEKGYHHPACANITYPLDFQYIWKEELGINVLSLDSPDLNCYSDEDYVYDPEFGEECTWQDLGLDPTQHTPEDLQREADTQNAMNIIVGIPENITVSQQGKPQVRYMDMNKHQSRVYKERVKHGMKPQRRDKQP